MYKIYIMYIQRTLADSSSAEVVLNAIAGAERRRRRFVIGLMSIQTTYIAINNNGSVPPHNWTFGPPPPPATVAARIKILNPPKIDHNLTDVNTFNVYSNVI